MHIPFYKCRHTACCLSYNFFYIKASPCILYMVRQVDRTWKPSVKILLSSFSAEFLRHCLLRNSNKIFYLSFPGIGGVFLMVALVCAVQLTICVVTEYRRLKAPTFLRACKVTTQKMLYFVAFLASLIRGAYFVSPVRII